MEQNNFILKFVRNNKVGTYPKVLVMKQAPKVKVFTLVSSQVDSKELL